MKSEFSQHFGALYQKPRLKAIEYIKANPKKSFCAMVLLLCTNFLLMLFIDTRGITKKDPFKSFGDYITKTSLYHPTNGRAEPTISNIMSLREIQDSLVFYADKANLKSRNDTITLKRLLKKYATVDPTIFKNR